MGVRVRENYVLVKASVEKMTSTPQGLFVVQDEIEKKTMETVVLAVGPDVTSVKDGDTVLIPYFAGTAWEDKIFLPEDEILAVAPSEAE